MMAGFARAAWRQLIAPEWRSLAFTLLLLMTVTNVLMALHDPKGGPESVSYTTAGAVQAIGLVSIAVALLRAATSSPRKRWAVDSGFWLFLGLYLVDAALMYAAIMVGRGSFILSFVALVAAMLIFAPLSAWQVVAATEEPLAWRPAPWFRDIGAWLVPLVPWLVVVALLAAALAFSGADQILQAGGNLVLPVVTGILGTLITLATLALRLAAYRAVARA